MCLRVYPYLDIFNYTVFFYLFLVYILSIYQSIYCLHFIYRIARQNTIFLEGTRLYFLATRQDKNDLAETRFGAVGAVSG